MWLFGRHSTLLSLTLHSHLVSFVRSFLFSDFLSFTDPPFTHRQSPHASPWQFAFSSSTFHLPSYPAASVETLPSFCFPGEWKCVKTWFDRGVLMHGFQSAAQKVLQGKGLQGMKSYLQRQPAPQSSQTRETPPCNNSPAEVLAGSLGKLLDSKLLIENIQEEWNHPSGGGCCLTSRLRKHVHPVWSSNKSIVFFFPLSLSICTNTFAHVRRYSFLPTLISLGRKLKKTGKALSYWLRRLLLFSSSVNLILWKLH